MKRNKTVWYEHQPEGTWRPDYPECSMYEYLKENARKTPDLNALWFEGKRTSYTQLIDKIDAASKGFAALGVKKGDMVPIISPNIPQAVYACYAVNRLGATANMLHPLLSPAEIKAAVVKAESRIIVVPDMFTASWRKRD